MCFPELPGLSIYDIRDADAHVVDTGGFIWDGTSRQEIIRIVPSALTGAAAAVRVAVHDRYARQAADVPGPLHHLHRANQSAAGRTGRPARQEPAARPHRDRPHRPTRPAPARFGRGCDRARDDRAALRSDRQPPGSAAGCPPGPRVDVGRASSKPPTPGSPVGSTTCGSPAPEPGWPLRPEWRPTSSSPRHQRSQPCCPPTGSRCRGWPSGPPRPARARSGPSAPHARASGGVAPDRRADADPAVVGYPAGCTRDRWGSISTACPPMCSSWGCVLTAPAMSIDCSTKRPTPASRCG